VIQGSLLDLPAPRAHKRQRQTAREVYRVQRAKDKKKAEQGQETRCGQVLRVLAWHWNVTQTSPTARELFEWATAKGERLDDINSIRPRLTKLRELGLVEIRGKRICEVSGLTVSTWAGREAGSVARQ